MSENEWFYRFIERSHSTTNTLTLFFMCIGPCIFLITEEYNPTRCHLLLYYAYVRLDVCRATLCPSLGAHGDSVGYHIGRLVLELLLVGILVQAGWMSFRTEGCNTTNLVLQPSVRKLIHPVCTKIPTSSNSRTRRPVW